MMKFKTHQQATAFADRLEEFIRAVAKDMESTHVEDAVRKIEIKQMFIDSLVKQNHD